MSENRNYYQVPEGTKTHKIINDFWNDVTNVRRSWKDFMDEAGGNLAYHNNRLQGITLDNPDLNLWHSPKSLPSNCYKPKRIKGSKWYKKFSQLKTLPTGMCLAERLAISLVFIDGRIHTPGLETKNGILILSLLKGTQPPSDVIALTGDE